MHTKIISAFLTVACLLVLVSMLTGCSKTNMDIPKPVDFNKLTIGHTKPNFYLMCPKSICSIDSDISPTFETDANTLYQAVANVVKNKARVKITSQDDKKYQLAYIQTSRFFNFPDYIDIQVFPVNNNQSTLAIFSRSRYGYYDFGVNKKRVADIIKELSSITSNIITS